MSGHEKYMHLALKEAELALRNGDFPVGCVIADSEGIVATGRREHSQEEMNELDHAEIVAVRNLAETIQIDPKNDFIVYSTMEPCLMCYSTLLLNNIRTIVFAYEDAMGGGTNLPLEKLSPLYAAMEVQVIPHVLRRESLALFQSFFKNPDNPYWRDSLLARYTLAQK